MAQNSVVICVDRHPEQSAAIQVRRGYWIAALRSRVTIHM